MISAIVLAAGQATRFGQCKQLARVGGKALLQHALDNLRASHVDDVVVVLGAHADEIREKVSFDRERIVFNPHYADGMSTSIQAGLRAIDAEGALIVLADQPFVAPATIDLLVEEHRRTRAAVVIPTYNGFRGNPVLVDRSLFAEMMDIHGDIGCRAVFGDHPESIVRVPVDDRGVVTDIDTQADLQRTEGEPPPIGGSCAHEIVVRNALEEGAPRLLTLDSTGAAEAKRFGIIDVPTQCYSGGVLEVFIEPSLPRPHMVVVGYETVARALVRIGKTLQFHVTVVDPLTTKGSAPEADEVVNELDLQALRLSGETYVVIATHGRYDEEAVEQAAKSGASYVALVASPKRARTVLETVRERGVDVGNVKSPAGLDIGAQGAEEIALSIVAEIVQRRHAGEAKRGAEIAASATAVDPVCGMSVTIADARHTADVEGQRHYFCCAHCRDAFTKSHVA
ncbi:MAG TPA: NTP transferase domain-containing protein [Thermoanaerobaculia bacterium]|nr:NTP transferase domain-containing protein [Thermoanaerobaculia bacterium]